MPNINVESLHVEHGATQIVGDPFEVTVRVNNRELAPPMPWKATRCELTLDSGETIAAHEATVEVDILRNGQTVASEQTTVCAPIDGEFRVPDPRPSWEFDLSTPGDYDVRATVDPAEHGHSSTKTRTISVEETGQQRPADDDGNGNGGDAWNPFPDRSPDPNDPLNVGAQMDKLLLVVGLLAVAWIASSGAEVAG